MYNVKRILYALGLDETDDQLLEHAVYINKRFSIDKMYFLNIQETLELPKKVLEKFPDMIAPKDENIKREISNAVEEVFGGEQTLDYEIKVDEGNVTEEIIRWAKIKEVDLIVVGKRDIEHEGKLSYSKLVNLAPCSLLVMPEALPELIRNFIVPIDFSDNSVMALEQSIVHASTIEDSHVQCVHFFAVPSGYHFSGKSREEFAEIMAHNSRDKFSKIMEKVDTKGVSVSCDYVLDNDNRVSKAIYKYAVKKQAAVISLGSKGRTALASLVRGSVAERLLEINTSFPLFVAKEKNHNMDLLDAIIDYG